VSPNETVAVQLADGRVMLNVRSPSKEAHRIVVYSRDGATRWSAPVFDPQLPDPVCFASMVRAGRTRLLFVSPNAGSRERKNLTVRLSDDEGKNWKVRRTLEEGPSAYSDLAVLPDGTILCFYEAGAKTPYDTLTIARFHLEWLKKGDPPRSLPRPL
jgi:sialidase-1